MSIFKSEKDIIEQQLWDVVKRGVTPNIHKNAKWFTVEDKTYVGTYTLDRVRSVWVMNGTSVSGDAEIARVVDSINALNGKKDFIDYSGNVMLGYLNA